MITQKYFGTIIIPNSGDSVEEIKEIRKKLSKEKFDLKSINNLSHNL